MRSTARGRRRTSCRRSRSSTTRRAGSAGPSCAPSRRRARSGVLGTLAAFVPVAVLVTIAPGPATAMVVRSAARGGRREALVCTVGNSLGVLAWGALAAAGVAAVVAASAEVFTAVKLVGAVVLVVLGVQSLRGRAPAERAAASTGRALRDGLVTSISNPKLAVFYVALFPQFVPAGAPVLPAALLMAATIVCFDLAWYSALAYAVARARRALVEGPWARRVERLTGAVLVGLGIRLALDRRSRALPARPLGRTRVRCVTSRTQTCTNTCSLVPSMAS